MFVKKSNNLYDFGIIVDEEKDRNIVHVIFADTDQDYGAWEVDIADITYIDETQAKEIIQNLNRTEHKYFLEILEEVFNWKRTAKHQ